MPVSPVPHSTRSLTFPINLTTITTCTHARAQCTHMHTHVPSPLRPRFAHLFRPTTTPCTLTPTPRWVREELHRWVYDNLRSKWQLVLRKPVRLSDMFSGYHATRALVFEVGSTACVCVCGVFVRACVECLWSLCVCVSERGWGRSEWCLGCARVVWQGEMFLQWYM